MKALLHSASVTGSQGTRKYKLSYKMQVSRVNNMSSAIHCITRLSLKCTSFLIWSI